jgi:uncharacterized protein YxeA
MKRLLIVIVILLITSLASAQTWHTANQGTFAWNASTTLSDGSSVPVNDTVKYQAYKRLSPALPTAGEKAGAEITTLQQTVSFTVEGGYFVGVSAIRYTGTERIGESQVAWSDNPAVCVNGQTFGFKYYFQIAFPTGLRQVQ